jgi:hypothetical protein
VRVELRAERHDNAPRPGVTVEVWVGEDEHSLEMTGKLALTRPEWEKFWWAFEMGGNEAGIDVIATEAP